MVARLKVAAALERIGRHGKDIAMIPGYLEDAGALTDAGMAIASLSGARCRGHTPEDAGEQR